MRKALSNRNKEIANREETKKKKSLASVGTKCYTNGVNQIQCFEHEVPEGYYPGRLHNCTGGTKCYTNGISNRFLKENDPIPPGYIRGQVKRKSK